MSNRFLTLTLLFAGAVSNAWPQEPAPAANPEPPSLEERWGVQITSLRLTAAGHLLDFRYKVLDAEKAKPLSVRQTKPYLESAGKRFPLFAAPRVGPLRSSYQPEAGTIYGVIFVNAYQTLKHGDKVSVVIGDFRADDVTVE